MSVQNIKAFQLLEFVTANKNRNKPLMIECVPSRWISFNPSIGKCQCKFMAPPCSKEDTELLDTLVKQQGLPPESWPTYTVNLRGHATTYDDAMKRLEILKIQPYAYTEDDVLPEKKATNVTKAYQRLKIKGDQALAEKLMQLEDIVSSTDQHSSTSEDCDENSAIKTPDVSMDENQIKKNKKGNRKKDSRCDTDTESSDENCDILNRSRNKPKHKPTTTESSKKTSTKNCMQEVPKNLSSRSTITSQTVNNRKYSQVPSPTSTVNREHKTTLLSNCRQVDVPEKPKESQTSESILHSSRRSSPPSRSQAPARVDPQTCQNETLQGLRYDIKELTTAFKELKGVIQRSALAQNAFGTNVQSFVTEYNVVFPITTMEDFHTFDDRLKMDKKLRKEFVSTLHFIVDSHTTLARNITSMLKKHISRDVALKFNAVKSPKHKAIFKETKLCDLLRDVLLLKYKEGAQGTLPITEKIFYRELGTCLSNALDWDGHRRDRSNNRKQAVESNAELNN